MKRLVAWASRHRVMLGVTSLALTGCYGLVLLVASEKTAATVGIGYIAVVATISLLLDILGGPSR